MPFLNVVTDFATGLFQGFFSVFAFLIFIIIFFIGSIFLIIYLVRYAGKKMSSLGKDHTEEDIALAKPVEARQVKNDTSFNETLQEIHYDSIVKKKLFSRKEYAFYSELKKQTDKQRILIWPKVRLIDCVEANATTEKILLGFHIDFLLVRNGGVIVGAVELDDDSHLDRTRSFRDSIKDEVLQKAGIKAERFAERAYSSENIAKLLNKFTATDPSE